MTDLEAARVAFDSHDWNAVIDVLDADDRATSPSADELLLLGDAKYWTGRFDESLGTFEAAFAKLVNEGRKSEAGLVAGLLSYLAFRRRTIAVASGWLAQAEGLLADEPEAIGHAWVALLYVGKALFADGDIPAAVELGDEAYQIAERVGSRSGQSLALSFKALAMIQQGQWREAMHMMDESSVMAMAGDDLRVTSDVYCNMISTCRNLGDYRRAGEWTEEADRWMLANSVNGYPGACQVHRAELKRLHGSWLEAEDEARSACQELERFQLTDYLGSAHFEIGEIRRRMGDLASAEASFAKAYEQGHDAQPGLSLLMVDRGELEPAFKSISGALGRIPFDPDHPMKRGPSRARLLPAFIEIALLAGDREAAADAVAQLETIADGYESHVWQAAARSARGSLQVFDGDNAEAIETLDGAWRMWKQADLPYEMARTRVRLGEAKRLVGDDAGGTLELKAALSTLQNLGAISEVGEVNGLLGEHEDVGTHAGSRVTRTFMFTDIVTSTDLIGLIGDASWRELLKWHDRTLRSAIEAAAGEVVRGTGDGYFASFAETRSAVDCAVDIQRRLSQHRRESGFAPQVRIGLHRTEATRDGADYSGGGIHLAARIGDQGSGEEVVVSASTLNEIGPLPYPSSEPLAVHLKGIGKPVELQRIDWR